jgi:hypothetical protein
MYDREVLRDDVRRREDNESKEENEKDEQREIATGRETQIDPRSIVSELADDESHEKDAAA